MKKVVPVTQNALYSCFALFIADLYSVDAFVAYKKLCFCFEPTYKYVLYGLMLPIGHVPTQIYVNKTYIPHYNMAIIYIYFVEYIFFYIFFTFG